MFLRHLTIENFRNLCRLEVSLDRTTLFIGEDGGSLAAVTRALSLCLEPSYGGLADWVPEDFFGNRPCSLVVRLAEDSPGDWPLSWKAALGGAITMSPDGRQHIIFRLRAARGATPEAEFVDFGQSKLRVDASVMLDMLRQRHPVVHVSATQPPDDDTLGRLRSVQADCTPVFVADHIESSMHLRMQRQLCEALGRLPVQAVLTSFSPEIIGWTPLKSIRRLVPPLARSVSSGISSSTLRKLDYHVRSRHPAALLARCWLLVNDETDACLVHDLAKACGCDLDANGIRCLNYSEAGVVPLIHLATDFGIEWQLLISNDRASAGTIVAVRVESTLLGGHDRITQIPYRTMHHLLWEGGYQDVYRTVGGPGSVGAVLSRLRRSNSRSSLNWALVEAASRPDSPGVPPVLKQAIASAIRRARQPGLV